MSDCATLGLQRNLIPTRRNASWTEQLGNLVFHWQVEQSTLANRPAYRSMIDPVMQRLLSALGETRLGMNTRDLQWNVQVVMSDDPNAAAFPGGGIFVNSGLLDGFARYDETFLAIALAHEIVHVTRGHLDARLRQDQLVAKAALSGVTFATLKPAVVLRVLLLMGIGELQQVTPFVKEQELEADQLGVFLLARAGYDPNIALSFWEKMATLSPQESGFNLTHPGIQERIDRLRAVLPAVQAYRSACMGAPTSGQNVSTAVDCHGAI